MDNWAGDAATKFTQKEQDRLAADAIICSEGLHKFTELKDMFQHEILQFNGQRKQQTLNISPDSDSFDITRQNSEKALRVVYDPIRNEIILSGDGGLEYEQRIAIKADLESKKAFFANSQNSRVNLNKIVFPAINALLGI